MSSLAVPGQAEPGAVADQSSVHALLQARNLPHEHHLDLLGKFGQVRGSVLRLIELLLWQRPMLLVLSELVLCSPSSWYRIRTSRIIS